MEQYDFAVIIRVRVYLERTGSVLMCFWDHKIKVIVTAQRFQNELCEMKERERVNTHAVE